MAAAAVALPVGSFALRFGFGALVRRWALFYIRHAIFVSRREGRLALIVAQRRTGAQP